MKFSTPGWLWSIFMMNMNKKMVLTSWHSNIVRHHINKTLNNGNCKQTRTADYFKLVLYLHCIILLYCHFAAMSAVLTFLWHLIAILTFRGLPHCIACSFRCNLSFLSILCNRCFCSAWRREVNSMVHVP